MTNPKFDATLRSIVREHGLGSVLEALGKIASEHDAQSAPPLAMNGVDKHAKPKKKARKRAPKPNAAEYAAKMELPSDRQAAVVALAERFERKAFLPSFGDVVNFCETYGIDVPASRTRANAIPRVFKFLANEMDADEIHRIVDYEMYSGPSRLGPIADAIRRNGRASRASR